MAMDLSGKTALITGGAKRIGREIALALAGEGVSVIINYRRSQDEAEELVGVLEGMGVKAWAVRADLSVEEEVGTLIDRTIELAGPLDILVNNASMFPRSTFANVTREQLLESVQVDAWAPLLLGRQFAERVEKGSIINMLDTRIVANYDWQHFAYLAAKHMLGLFTKAMAIQLAPGIAVNGISPGLILPPEGKDESYLEALKNELPMKRIGKPEFIAEAALFLLKSEFITGEVIFVDGGRHLGEVKIG